MNNTLIVHHVDMDGYSSAFLLAQNKGECDFYAAQYGEGVENALSFIKDNQEKYDEMYIVDLSLSKEQADEMVEIHGVYQYDHHVITYNAYPWQKIVYGKSATKIIAEEFNMSGVYTQLVAPVNAADIFQKDDMDMFLIGRRITHHLNNLHEVYEEGLNTPKTKLVLCSIEAALKRASINESGFLPWFMFSLDTYTENLIFQAKQAMEDGRVIENVFYALDIDGNPSDIFDVIKEWDIKRLVSGNSEKGTVAIRGDGARDLAVQFGGGGHPVAAGCRIESGFESLQDLIDIFKE